jgi:hypothetical protein
MVLEESFKLNLSAVPEPIEGHQPHNRFSRTLYSMSNHAGIQPHVPSDAQF